MATSPVLPVPGFTFLGGEEGMEGGREGRKEEGVAELLPVAGV